MRISDWSSDVCSSDLMAEMHPILWTRLADRRLGHPHVKVAVLSTFTHRSMDLADIPIIFKPGTDLAVLNYIANHIITTGRVNEAFVSDHTNFMKRTGDNGYGLRPEHQQEMEAEGAGDAAKMEPADFETIRTIAKAYTHDRAWTIGRTEGKERGDQ